MVYLITRGVADRYDNHELAKSIAEGDLRLWQSEREGGCALIGQILASYPKAHAQIPAVVLDFGGGGGRHGFDVTRQGLAKWTVVETPALSDVSSKVLGETGIRFVSTIDDAITPDHKFDVVHVSSSLQYTSDPQGILTSLLDLNPDFVVFEKLVLTERKNSVKLFQYSLLRDNIPEPPRTWKLWINAVRYPLTAIPTSVFYASLGRDFEIVNHLVEPVQSHLPLFKGLAQHTFLLKRKGV